MNELGKEYPEGMARKSFLSDNADSVEPKGYLKRFTDEQIVLKKNELSEISIQINDLMEEKKEVMDKFKAAIKPLVEGKGQLLKNLKMKAEYVREDCYKFLNAADNTVTYYNSLGDWVETRSATADELQTSIFQVIRKTGTNN